MGPWPGIVARAKERPSRRAVHRGEEARLGGGGIQYGRGRCTVVIKFNDTDSDSDADLATRSLCDDARTGGVRRGRMSRCSAHPSASGAHPCDGKYVQLAGWQ